MKPIASIPNVLISLFLLLTFSAKGQIIPVNFHQYNPIHAKEVSVELHGGNFLGTEVNYTLPKNFTAFMAFNADCIPYIRGNYNYNKTKLVPTTLSIGAGISYILALPNPYKKLSFTLGAAAISYQLVRFYNIGTPYEAKASTTYSTIVPCFMELNYILIRNDVTHYFSASTIINWSSNTYRKYETTDSRGINSRSYPDERYFTIGIGYGFKVRLKSFKIGAQLGAILPATAYQFNKYNFFIESNSTLPEIMKDLYVFNVNFSYAFERNKTKEKASK